MNAADSIHRMLFKLRDCSEVDRLRSIPACTRFLHDMVASLRMTTLAVTCVPVYGTEPHLTDEGGVTGVAIISTSHVAIHTWPEHRAANVDVYSCQPWHKELAIELCARIFGGRVEGM